MEDYAIVTGSLYSGFSWDVTGIVKEWYSSGVNNGLMLKTHDEAAGYTELLSSDCDSTVAGCRPQVTLCYINNSGLESCWTYHSQDVGRAGTGYVNDYNGNLIFTHDDLSMTGNKMPTVISHVYNSSLRSQNLNYGKGWRLNYSQTVVPVTIYIGGSNVTYYKYTDGDGTDHYFQDGTSPITEEINPDLKLTKNANGTYTIKDKSDNSLNFSSTGVLTSIADNNGSTATLSYTSGKLTGVTDGA